MKLKQTLDFTLTLVPETIDETELLKYFQIYGLQILNFTSEGMEIGSK